MFGHVDHYRALGAAPAARLRDLQARTGGFTEFVPLPFVPMETPMHLQGPSRLRADLSRSGADACGRRAWRFIRSMTNIQTSWVKMGRDGAAACLKAGANDLGGTLMNESITRAAGAVHGQEMPPEAMEDVIASLGRRPRQRTTLYGEASRRPDRCLVQCGSAAAAAVVQRIGSRAAPDPQEPAGARKSEQGRKRGWNLAYACQQRHTLGGRAARRGTGLHLRLVLRHAVAERRRLVAMGAAAMKTSRIKLCAGVFIPSNRIAPVAANALATLNALAPGRVVFGTLDRLYRSRTHGLGPVTLARLETYVEVVEGLLKGKTVEWSEEGGTHKIRFLNPDLGLINIADPIPTFMSAFGPKARALTAKLGAGWIGAVSYPQREQADIEDIRAAWQRVRPRHGRFLPRCEHGRLRARRGRAR